MYTEYIEGARGLPYMEEYIEGARGTGQRRDAGFSGGVSAAGEAKRVARESGTVPSEEEGEEGGEEGGKEGVFTARRAPLGADLVKRWPELHLLDAPDEGLLSAVDTMREQVC